MIYESFRTMNLIFTWRRRGTQRTRTRTSPPHVDVSHEHGVSSKRKAWDFWDAMKGHDDDDEQDEEEDV